VNETGVERLKADREHVFLSLDGARTDLQLLDALLSRDLAATPLADIEAAAEIIQGEFLDGLDLSSCYRFHHWCLTERERWGALRRRVLLAAVTCLASEPHGALPHARALIIAADPLSETAHAQLVTLLTSLGRRKDVQEHYVNARDMLRRETGSPLLGELKRPPHPADPWHESSIALTVKQPVRAQAAAAAAHHAGLAGRTRERKAIEHALASLGTRPMGKGLLFLGEPGIGKSRLLAFATGRSRTRFRCLPGAVLRPMRFAPLVVGRISWHLSSTPLTHRFVANSPCHGAKFSARILAAGPSSSWKR